MTRKTQRLCLAGIMACGIGAFMPAGHAQEPAAPPATQVPAEDGAWIDVRDADVGYVYKMLFDGYKQDYILAPSVRGTVTGRATGQSMAGSLQFLARFRELGLKAEQKGRIWMVTGTSGGTKASVKATESSLVSVADAAKTVKEVPRRVAAILVLPGSASALLINGPESSPDAVTRVVKVGDKVPAGIAGVAPLVVTRIDKAGVEMTESDGEQASFLLPVTTRAFRQPAEKY